MSGHTFGELPPDETERPTGADVVPADRTTRTDFRGTDVVALTGDELVARALAILADEKDRWHAARLVAAPPRASS
jgi:hypothetical protein